jgi:DNA-binding PadR family transcriptional regulator
MFDHHIHGARPRRNADPFDMGRQLREELRRNFGHGHGRQQPGFGDLLRAGRHGPIRRGEVRPLILAALAQRPMHGYELIQELEAQSGGRWRPSAGSIYPTLQQLSDEGLVTGEDVDGRRVYTLTEDGRKASAENPTRAPWGDADDEPGHDMRQLAMQLAAAVIQVHRVGTPQARREATRILTDARKEMYKLLSEDDDPTNEAGAPG